MADIHDSLAELVGGTPLVRLGGFEKARNVSGRLYGKMEYFNPIGSIKDRIVLRIIEEAEKSGAIDPRTTTLVECTSGNTGIAVAAFGAMKGYRVRIYLQDGVSEERRKIMQAFGAEVTNVSQVPAVQEVLKATGNDFVAGTAKLKETLRAEKGIYFVDQMLNPLNPEAHRSTTGPEILEALGGSLGAVVSAVGTAGTIRGISDYVKSKDSSVKVIAVEPTPEDKVLTGIHNFTEVPEERVPPSLTDGVYDEVLVATPDDAFAASRDVAKSDGVLVGISSGAALWGAAEVARRPEFSGKNVVVIFPDTGLRYLSTPLFG